MSKRNKFNRKHKQIQTRPIQPQVKPEVMPALDINFATAAKVFVPEWNVAQIVVAGAGGTGAYMVQHLGRAMRVLYESGKGVHLTVVDPDVVEERNIGRQLFCDAEVGLPKAEAIARRYGHAWGLNCTSFVGEYDDSLLLGTEMTLLVGCVDNAAARRKLADTLTHNDHREQKRVWWLDCGNLRDTGRVLMGNASSYQELRGAFLGGDKPGDARRCVQLPSPALQFPDLLVARDEELPDARMSCAEMLAANLQSLQINARIAAEAADFATRLLVTGDLRRFACEINLAAGSTRSSYTTPEIVAASVRKGTHIFNGSFTDNSVGGPVFVGEDHQTHEHEAFVAALEHAFERTGAEA